MLSLLFISGITQADSTKAMCLIKHSDNTCKALVFKDSEAPNIRCIGCVRFSVIFANKENPTRGQKFVSQIQASINTDSYKSTIKRSLTSIYRCPESPLMSYNKKAPEQSQFAFDPGYGIDGANTFVNIKLLRPSCMNPTNPACKKLKLDSEIAVSVAELRSLESVTREEAIIASKNDSEGVRSCQN